MSNEDPMMIDESDREQREYEKPKLGSVRAKITGAWYVGYQPGYQGKPPRKQVVVSFEVDRRDTKGQRHVVQQAYAMSLYEKAPLRHLLDALFPDEPKEKFSVSRVIGMDCYVTIGLSETGKVRIVAVMGLPDGMQPLSAEREKSEPWGLASYMLDRQASPPPKASAPKPEKPKAVHAAPALDPEDPIEGGGSPIDGSDVPF